MIIAEIKKRFARVVFFILTVSILFAGCARTKAPNYRVSVDFGKAYAYSPHSNEILDWSGEVKVAGGSIDSIFKLTYGITNWAKGYGGCSREYSRKLDQPEWTTDFTPGSGRGLEGIRLFVSGDTSALVTIETRAASVSFTIGELLDKEYIEFPVGGHYSYQPIAVYLGPDARPRISRKDYARILDRERRVGTLLVPDDFEGPKTNFMSAWCAVIDPGKSISTEFGPEHYNPSITGKIPIKLEMMATAPRPPDEGYETASGWVDFRVSVGSFSQELRHFFTFFRQAEKMFDFYVEVPPEAFNDKKNTIRVENEDSTLNLLLNRVFINEPPVSLAENIHALPPLPGQPDFWVGYDLNTLTTQDGEVDSVLDRMHREQMGNYVLFRIEETSTASPEDMTRWGRKAMDYHFRAGTTMGGKVPEILTTTMGANFMGIHQHEASNLIYGWGDAEPKEARKDRTLPDCEAAYMARMKNIKMLGQALPMCNLDYKSGVGFISSEFPTGHSTLMMAANRGGSYLYDKPYWGVHLANHVMRMPDDQTTLRRNFMFIWQSWLYGARLVYDEESALYGIHSTSYSFSDPMTVTRRRQMQELWHYGSAVDLGQEEVKTGFLIGKYDCLVGGVQSSPDMDPTKVWGMFGPETEAWKFDTPERGWELLDTWMPGVWLYPVKQDPSSIRMFLGGSPGGQVDLVTIDGPLDKLQKYDLLVLPGWNTMTDENYQKLIAYVQNGGHLVLAATQCTNHITRDFLLQKKDFDFYHQGDLTGLCGIRVNSLAGPLGTITWSSGKSCSAKDLPGLSVDLVPGTTVLARSQSGSPVMVENTIGNGRVWTLVAGEYWGAPALDGFRAQLGDTLVAMHKGDLFVTGDCRDVDYHVYDLPDHTRRVVFLNTDWTRSGNEKKLTLHLAGKDIPLTVREGNLVDLLIAGNLSLMSEMPGSGARFVNQSGDLVTLSLSGTGHREFVLYGANKPEMESVDSDISLDNNIIKIDFGTQWEERIVQLRLGD